MSTHDSMISLNADGNSEIGDSGGEILPETLVSQNSPGYGHARNTAKYPDPDPGITSSEKVFTIDHILEKILYYSSLNTSDLLRCRAVCRRWQSFAREPLVEKLSFYFTDTYKYYAYNNSERNMNSLSKLNVLLQNSIPNTFPCNKFGFRKLLKIERNLNNGTIQQFLNTYGHYIHKLSINFTPTFIKFKDKTLPTEFVVMEQVRKLILYQTPNLDSLRLGLDAVVEWKNPMNSDGSVRSNRSTLRTTDAEFVEIHSRTNSDSNSKLRLLYGYIPSAKILEVVIYHCTGLEEISGRGKKDYCYFLEPLNRLHFLKDVKLYLYQYGIEIFEQIAAASHEGNFQLTSFVLYLCSVEFEFGNYVPTEIETRVVNVVNRFFECSTNSLVHFEWSGITSLRGLKWPKIMPSVTSLYLSNPFWGLVGSRLFPRGFSLAKTFPNLRYVTLGCTNRSPVTLIDFIAWFNVEQVPVPTVKRVTVRTWNEQVVSLEESQKIHTLFPNAIIEDVETRRREKSKNKSSAST